MPKRVYKAKIKKTTPYGIFAQDPSFFSHFLIKQEIGEPTIHYLERYKSTCGKPTQGKWNYFIFPQQAQGLFFLVGLRNRWFAREVFAACQHWQFFNLADVVLACRDLSRKIALLQSAQRSGSLTTSRSKHGIWGWAQYRPNSPVYQLELLRYQLLTGLSYQGNFPNNLPAFPPDFSDHEITDAE